MIRDLLAVQAENPSQAEWAVASRAQLPNASELAALLDRGSVVRTHVLRPTWHFVAAEDIGWLLELTAPRIRPLIARQLEDAHGLTGPGLDRVASMVLQALSERPDQTREELAECLRGRGVEPRGQLLMLLLALLELDRLICSGRRLEGAHTYAPSPTGCPQPGGWTATRRSPSWRCATSLATVPPRSVTSPTGRPFRSAMCAVASPRSVTGSAPSITRAARSGTPPSSRRRRDPVQPTGHLLQILDEVYRGYQDSRMVLDSEGIVPSGRETAIGMALVDAQMVARMKRTIGRRVTFDITPYDGTLTPSHRSSVEQAAARYAEFLGLEHELRVH